MIKILHSFPPPVQVNRTVKTDAIASPAITAGDVQPPVDVTHWASAQQIMPTLPSHQDQNIIPSVSSPVLVPPYVQPASVNLLLTGVTPITNLPEVSFQTPATAAPLETQGQSHSSNLCEIQFMPTLTASPTFSDDGAHIDAVASAIPLSAPPPPPSSASFNQSNYVLNGPYINPNFSKVINLPVTPSPPPLLEADENMESSNEKMIASPAKQSEHESSEPSIPLSHLITANQYPSLNKIPPAHIAQSFAPMYVSQQQHTHHQQQQPSEGEIYRDYVNNPYNLTLQVDQSYNPVGSSETVATTTAAAAPNMNVFQSVNYFGSANDATIPPGSEMLFGAP